MKRCKHNNCCISEEWGSALQHYFRNGKYDESNATTGNLTNVIFIECYDCGMEKHYMRRNCPKWVSVRIKHVIDQGVIDER